jgi:O-antigen/teichoic acid export membrane protein
MTTVSVDLRADLAALPPPGVAGDVSRAPAPAAFKVIQAATTVTILQVSILVVMLARSKLTAMLLGPEGVGIVGTFDQLVQFVAQLSAFSLIAAPSRFIARAALETSKAVASTYEAFFKLLLLTTMIGTVGAILVLRLDPHIMGQALHEYGRLTLLVLTTVPVITFSSFYVNVAAAATNYKTATLYLLVAAVVALISAFCGIKAGGIPGLYLANLMSGGALVVAFASYLHRKAHLKLHQPGFRLRTVFQRWPDLLPYCSTTYVLSFAQPLAFLIVRGAVIKGLGAAQAGYFQVAFALSSIASMVLTQLIRIYLEPRLNSVGSARAKIDSANEFQRSFCVLVMLGSLPIVLFPRELVSMLYTRQFAPISPVLYLFVVADCVFLSSQVYATAVMALDDFRAYFQIHLAGLLTLSGLAWMLAPRFGLPGVAWSFLASRCLVFGLIQFALRRRHGLGMTRQVVATLSYAVGVPVVIALALGSPALSSTGSYAARAGLWMAIALGTVGLLTRSERMWLIAMGRSVVARPNGGT